MPDLCPLCHERERLGPGRLCRPCTYGEPEHPANRDCPLCRMAGRECDACRRERQLAERRAMDGAIAGMARHLAASGHDVQVATGHTWHGTGERGEHAGAPTGFRRLEVPDA